MDEMGMWHTILQDNNLIVQILRFIHFIEIPRSIYNDGGECDDRGERGI